MTEPYLAIRDLKKFFPLKRGLLGRPTSWLRAVDGVSFSIERGETLGLVGESGCGKSTTGRMIVGLTRPTSGSVLFKGSDVHALASRERRELCRRIQIVFQDPYGSLSPRMNVADIVCEAPLYHGIIEKSARRAFLEETLLAVGLHPDDASRYPHEFSGGQRQRIGIARALAMRPEFVVCDEPVSALDVSIQGQILNLLNDLKKKRGLTYLFISHELAAVRYLCDRVIVLYLGKIVEEAPNEPFFAGPLHPYSRMLLEAFPDIAPRDTVADSVPESRDAAQLLRPEAGCAFAPRCPHVMERCRIEEPALVRKSEKHAVACFLCEDGR